MDTNSVNNDLSELVQSANGCEYTDLEDGFIDKIMLDNNTNFNILHLNIRSFNRNCDSLTFLLNDLRNCGIVIHAISLCETFLSATTSALVSMENYKIISRCREGRSGGGVMLLIHDSIKNVNAVDVPFNSNFEGVAVRAKYQGEGMFLAEFYRPPNSDDNIFIQSLKNAN